MLDNIGERGRNRTYNLLIKSQLLCQLSYAPREGLTLRIQLAKPIIESSMPPIGRVLEMDEARASKDCTTLKSLVRTGRVELPWPRGRWNLNPVRLPVPPRSQPELSLPHQVYSGRHQSRFEPFRSLQLGHPTRNGTAASTDARFRSRPARGTHDV